MPKTDGTGRVDAMQGAAGVKDAAPVAEQSQKDRKTVQMVEKLFRRYKAHRMNYDADWVDNYKFYRGEQWAEKRPSYRNSDVLNFTHAAVQTIIPIITDARPNIETIPENPSDFEFSEIMSQLMRAKWDRDAFSQVVAEGFVDAMIYGTAISEQQWDQELHNGLGDYRFETVDPLFCYPDPRARDVNDQFGKGFITAIPTDTAEVKKKYPQKAHMIKSDISDLDSATTAKLHMEDYRIRSSSDNYQIVQGDRPQDADNPDQTLVITAWLHDDTMVEEEITERDKDGKKVSKGFRQRKKYPNGRKIVIANKILLEDEENPYIDGKFPFAKLVDYILPREFWGEGEIAQLKGPQETINKLASYVMDILQLMGNPVWLNPVESGVDDETITNRPGLVIPWAGEQAPQRAGGVEVQSSFFQFMDRMEKYFEKIHGINEVTQGAVPSGMSGVAIEELQEAAQTRIRLKARNGEAWLTAVGQQFASRIMQFYSTPRIIRVTENENAAKYFKIVIDDVTDKAGETRKVATIQQFEERQTADGVEQVAGDPQEFELKGNLDIRITVGTTLPFRKAQRKAQAKELFQLGIYDEEDLLEDLEHPRATKILEKVNQRRQAEAEAQAALEEQEAAFREAELQAKGGGAATQQPAPSPGPLAAVQP
jgi:hypothetical protein